MKPCRRNRKLIAWLVMDALEASETAQLNQHLRNCEGCRQYRREISMVKHRIASIDTRGALPSRRSVSRLPQIKKLTSGAPALQGLNWRFALSAVCAIMLGILIFSVLMRRSAAPSVPHPSNFVTSENPSADLLPTLGLYRAVANESLDELDDLLARQGKRPVAPSGLRGVSLALVKVGD